MTAELLQEERHARRHTLISQLAKPLHFRDSTPRLAFSSGD
jgi:hypothetical protein